MANDLYDISLFVTAPAMNYNFCSVHQTLRVTPARESGLADHVWTLEDFMARFGGIQRQ
jgi:hypothetical protein